MHRSISNVGEYVCYSYWCLFQLHAGLTEDLYFVIMQHCDLWFIHGRPQQSIQKVGNSLLTGKWQQRILARLCKLAWKDKLQCAGSSRGAGIALPTHPPYTAYSLRYKSCALYRKIWSKNGKWIKIKYTFAINYQPHNTLSSRGPNSRMESKNFG
jgi:hypothetical protein